MHSFRGLYIYAIYIHQYWYHWIAAILQNLRHIIERYSIHFTRPIFVVFIYYNYIIHNYDCIIATAAWYNYIRVCELYINEIMKFGKASVNSYSNKVFPFSDTYIHGQTHLVFNTSTLLQTCGCIWKKNEV